MNLDLSNCILHFEEFLFTEKITDNTTVTVETYIIGKIGLSRSLTYTPTSSRNRVIVNSVESRTLTTNHNKRRCGHVEIRELSHMHSKPVSFRMKCWRETTYKRPTSGCI